MEYLITTPEQQADFESQADDGWAYYDELDGFVPVSYTHLDVYKRQFPTCPT